MHKSFFALFAALALSAFAAELTEEEWAAMREAAIARPRIIIDDDGCDMTEVPKELPCTREAIYAQMLDNTKGSQVDTISFCPFSVGHRLATRSLVTDIHVADAALPQNKNLTPELLAMGTDTMQLAVEFCRANHFSVLANFRVNDIHDSWYTKWMYGIKVEHPEQLVGTENARPPFGQWTAFNFAVPEVRARVRAICEELLSNYDVDGLELDFYRFPLFFKSVAWGGSASQEELDAMTQLVRDIRADADRIGRARKRYLIIVARMPDSAVVAKNMGLDIETWFEEKLIDIYVSGGDNGYYNTYKGAVELAHKYGVRVFPSVDTSWMGGDRSCIAGFTAQSSAALAAGADGLFYFNMFYYPSYIPKMRRNLSDMRFEQKHYFGYYQRFGSFFTMSDKDIDLDELNWRRGDGIVAVKGKTSRMQMEIGDDFTDPEVIEQRPVVTMKVSTDCQDEMPMAAAINGVALGKPSFIGGNYLFDVQPSIVKQGANLFEVSLGDDTPVVNRMIMKGDQLLKGKIQAPWRRLFPAHDFAHAEEIVDNSYRLRDSGTGLGECENLLYPLGNSGDLGCSFELMVEEATAAEAVVLRLANADYTEVITFGMDMVGFKFAGVSVPFKTSGAFHKYECVINGKHLTLSADGKELLAADMVMEASDKAGFMQGYNIVIPYMNERSLVVGSLSQEGTGVSRWKNVSISTVGLPLKDIQLDVDFLGKEDKLLKQLVEDAPELNTVLFDASAGGVAAGVKSNYPADCIAIADGVAELKCSAKSQYAMIEYDDAILASTDGVLAVEWEVEPMELADNKAHCFQMVLQPACPEGGYYLLPFKFAPGKVTVPWGNIDVALPDGLVTCRAILNIATGKAVFLVDGKQVANGTVGERGKKASIFFGDASGYVDGWARLKSVKMDIIK